jgi:hypothetical protein
MSSSTQSPVRACAAIGAILFATALLGGCTVITVAGAAVGVAATGVGLAADAAVGTVRLTGKAVGAMLPGSAD